ncbi:MAG TPA: UDP-N-acetylmuramoyl-L-alanine--D-glutamate ligase [Rhizomicrobium sp.]|jgi:UDP-N-acetylmuramoylalanine--D-glutamate ligase|nr:UDP-N-acetylmuramoyl-L-alanine--D-glutamate ligase [Rhizomicrobium sp.]
MITVRTFSDRDVGVFGLARSGLSAIASLKAGGARLYAWDESEEGRAEARDAGARVAPFASWPWERIRALVLSPGVPLTHPAPHEVVLAARQAGAEVIGDVELFAREIRPDRTQPGRAPVIAVTGTNGKSTTTALIGHILTSCGFPAQVGGNIGKPALDLAAPNGRTIYVLEISSYQIDLAPGFTPDIAVLTNISPDHLERHGSFANYAAVKARLLEQTSTEGDVVIGIDDPSSAVIYSRLALARREQAIPVSIGKVLGRGVFAVDGALYDAWGSRASKVMDLALATRLPGTHNWQNAALAYAAVKPIIQDPRAIASAIASFPGLPHRIEDVARIGRVRFINDSKATNADAAARALACFNDIYWIAGGRPKQGGIDSLLAYAPHIRKAYLIGEGADAFSKTLDGHVALEQSGTLDNAVPAALADAARSHAAAPVVLLSPACASFDQFRDYEDRGERFRAIAESLARFAQKEAS